MPTSSLVRKANKASSTQLLRALDALNATHTPRVALSAELGETEKNDIWAMFEDNMHDLYSQSSFGWDPPSKRAELFDSLSRFILINASSQLVAFSMFRFEHELGEDILYCYDLQTQRIHRRTGLGSLLMRALEIIGTEWRIEKIVLTVFKANRPAMKFYGASGFSMDETSPGYLEDGEDPADLEDVDYDILSKRLA